MAYLHYVMILLSPHVNLSPAFSSLFVTYGGDKMLDWKKWIDQDVIITLKNGKQKSGIFKGPVIPLPKGELPEEFRLLNGIFVTRIKPDDIASIQETF